MTYQSALDIGRANAMAGHVQHVIRSSDYGEVTVSITNGYVSSRISIGHSAPVFGIAFWIAIHRAEHVRERASQHQQAAFIRRQLVALCVDPLRYYTGQRPASLC